MDRESHAQALADVDAALWAGVVFPEALPEIASQLLADGADTPSLRDLAGLDLEPFDPRDARDLFIATCEEIGLTVESIAVRVGRCARVLASALLGGRITEREATRRYYRLAVTSEHYDDRLVTALFGMEDEWDSGWGRSAPKLAREVRTIAAQILAAGPLPPDYVVSAVHVGA